VVRTSFLTPKTENQSQQGAMHNEEALRLTLISLSTPPEKKESPDVWKQTDVFGNFVVIVFWHALALVSHTFNLWSSDADTKT